VEDLVLVGDIPDRTLSSTSQISANTHAFAMMLGDALEIERAVYVPGNHDHILWSGYNGAPGITNYSGKDVVRNGNCLDGRAEEILSIFLGYPIGWAWCALERKDEAEGRVAKLTDPHGEPSSDSLERFRKLFLPHLETHVQDRQLEGRGLPTEELFFVYGDTHQGGWGDLNVPGRSVRVRVYNCGGWVVDGPSPHPACHLFAVDDEGQEFILDVSFAKDLEGKSVQVGDDALLWLAGRDAEHRIEAVNRAGLAFGRGWQYLRGRFG
jgi:hypothetical protein